MLIQVQIASSFPEAFNKALKIATKSPIPKNQASVAHSRRNDHSAAPSLQCN